LGFAGAFKTVHDNQRECLLWIPRLPVAPAADLNAGSDFDQPFFRRGQMNPARQKKSGDRLYVTSA
jgi:hypothetical protein